MGSNADVPPPPWRKTRRPLKPQLSQELIVETGLRILDAEGLEGLSMRRVAQELDTGPASLYAHVANKDELLELLYDRVLGEVQLPEPDPSRWKEQLREAALRTHQVLAAHADIARVAMAGIPSGENALRLGEYVFGLLIDAGMAPRDASLGFDRLVLYIVGDAYEGSLHYSRAHAAGITNEKEYFEHFIAQIGTYFQALPPDRFPHLTRHVGTLLADDGETRFRFGLDLLLDGLESRMPPGSHV
uniref:TetR/AcrR family transcriptional regulator n=1 Tax=Nonomuraea pusilla TaxID=46177 RepID=UPI0006E399BC|nr:TetR/AcrR family transcriptional regulator C-terminal domain-containing protein [Nonomuraea pusilla]